jgi:putative FmdB family regulatory protein
MPIYLYKCPVCQEQFERVEKISDIHKANCPKCGKAASRVFLPTGIIFKGSGFYVTDYKKSEGNGHKEAHKEVKEKKPAETKAKPTKKASEKASSSA